MTEIKSGWDDFLDIWKKFRALTVVALGSGAAIPFLAYVASITPPWPTGIVLITGLIELVVIILVFQFLRPAGRKKINQFMRWMAPLLFGLSALYLLVFAMFTYEVPLAKMRSVTGFICKQEIPRKTAAECPIVGYERIKDAEYTAELIWIEWTVKLMRFIIAVIWLACFTALSSLIGAFLVFQTKVRAKARP